METKDKININHCPLCGLKNPPTSQRCDCGFDFILRKVEPSYLDKKEKKIGQAGQAVYRQGWAWLIVIVIAWFAEYLAMLMTNQFSQGLRSDIVSRLFEAFGATIIILLLSFVPAFFISESFKLANRPLNSRSFQFVFCCCVIAIVVLTTILRLYLNKTTNLS